jgi:branched-subunit amino acid transport protein AzlD
VPNLKWIVVIAFLLIIGSLVSAMFFLIRDRGRSRNTMRALGFRVGFSVLLFLIIVLSHQMGWIKSTGIPIYREAPR